MKCEALTKSGKPCRSLPTGSGRYCPIHDPEKAEQMAAGRRAGGRAATAKPSPRKETFGPLSLSSADDIVCAAREAVNHVRSGALTPKQGSAIGSLLSVALQGLKRVDDKRKGEGDGRDARPLSKATVARLQEIAGGLTDADTEH